MKRFAVSTDYPEHRYSCIFPYDELIKDTDNTAEEVAVLGYLEIDKSFTVEFGGGRSTKYTRID